MTMVGPSHGIPQRRHEEVLPPFCPHSAPLSVLWVPLHLFQQRSKGSPLPGAGSTYAFRTSLTSKWLSSQILLWAETRHGKLSGFFGAFEGPASGLAWKQSELSPTPRLVEKGTPEPPGFWKLSAPPGPTFAWGKGPSLLSPCPVSGRLMSHFPCSSTSPLPTFY